MSGWTRTNFGDLRDVSPQDSQVQWRFAREALGSPELGVSRFTYEPGARMPWGHRHRVQEEAYVVVAGSGRAKLDDAIVELSVWDVLRVAPAVVRSFEAGPEGLDVICIGGRKPTGGDTERFEDFWPREPMSSRRGRGRSAMTTTTHTLETAGAEIAYDVHGPLPTADGRPVLLMIGQPMDSRGFSTLASYFPDRTVVTYDPRGLGRSVRKDGRTDHSPTVQAEDVHAVIEALGAGPVEIFASSGGAVTALALVAAHPDDVTTLVAHEPPLIPVLPDAEGAERARAGFRDVYEAKGSGAGMAAFIAMSAWRGEFTDDYFAQPPADPAQLGMPTEDDGSRDDPLLSDRSWAVSSYRPDVQALAAAATRIVVAVGEESEGTFTGRTAVGTAELLGQEATVFPSHHGGFLGGEFGYAGQPEAFARKLREVLDGS